MSTKIHRDFVVLVRGKEEINALVIFAHDVTTPATQETPAKTVEYLTVVFPGETAQKAFPSKAQILDALQVEMSVPPVGEGQFFGWKDVPNLTAIATPEEESKFDALGAGAHDQFKVGDIVRFTPESGNDQTKTFTIDGGELAGDNLPQWFWRLVELPGALFLAASLELALPKPETIQPDPAVVEAAQPMIEPDPAVTAAAATE